jgi:hypothetical protein
MKRLACALAAAALSSAAHAQLKENYEALRAAAQKHRK